MNADIERQAADWVARRDAGDWDGDQQAALTAWLDASVAHRVAYLRLSSAWETADRMAALRPGPPIAEPALGWRGRIREMLPLAASIAIIIGIGAIFTAMLSQSGARAFDTAVGQQEQVALADGSRVHLNTDTLLKTRITPRERRVTLERGEAFFEVASNPRLPFTIEAGPKRITVLGTKFSVRRDGDEVKVVVAEGRVRISDVEAARSESAVIATTGDMMMVHANQTLLAHRNMEQVDRELSWRRGVLSFDRETLSAAAEEFNRYNVRQLEIAPEVADIRIGGSFRAGDLDDFAYLLRHAFDLTVEERGDKISVRR